MKGITMKKTKSVKITNAPKIGAKAQRRYIRNVIVGTAVTAACVIGGIARIQAEKNSDKN